MPISKDAVPIETLEDWKKRAGPKTAGQWADGRSAKEAARAWLQGGPKGLPEEILAAIESSAAFGPVVEWRAEPKVKLPFDRFCGEPRNSDLVVWARDAHGSYIVAIEAKADEPFAEKVGEVLHETIERMPANSRSNGFARVEQLLRALLPARAKGMPAVIDLRYQLLTACAGALAEAERHSCDRAVMLVHEFVTDKTTDKKHEANAADLAHFLCRISAGAADAMEPGRLYGPYFVPGQPLLLARTALYLGKVQRNLRGGAKPIRIETT